ncbi:hypothetical protein DFH09DRAFT_1370174 [Mycena vulgaris]|nr:hypothetical protein DFH09DRAFT_1370174 [Mycena vulgaris]
MATEWDSQDYGRGIPPPIQLNDQSAVNWYHTKLEASRRLAERNPLAADQSYSLALTIPQSNLLPTARSVPPLLHSSTTSLRLDKPLQTGAGKLSQVWTAVVEGTRTTLVLKIIQPSMCRYPSPDRCWSEYMVPEDLALPRGLGSTSTLRTSRVSWSLIFSAFIQLTPRQASPRGRAHSGHDIRRAFGLTHQIVLRHLRLDEAFNRCGDGLYF